MRNDWYVYICACVYVCVRTRGTLLLYHIATHTSNTVPFLLGTAETKNMYNFLCMYIYKYKI